MASKVEAFAGSTLMPARTRVSTSLALILACSIESASTGPDSRPHLLAAWSAGYGQEGFSARRSNPDIVPAQFGIGDGITCGTGL